MVIKKTMALLGIVSITFSLWGCGKTVETETTAVEETTETETVSSLYNAEDTVLTYYRIAESEETGSGYNIYMKYYVSQIITVSEGGELIDIDITNFNLIQPPSSVINLNGGYLYGAEGELITPVDNRMHIPETMVSRNASNQYDVRFNLLTDYIGNVVTTETDESIIFNNYVRSNAISSTDLRGKFSFTIEINVRNSDGSQQTLSRDFELIIIPGNFLTETIIEEGNIFTYNNSGSFE